MEAVAALFSLVQRIRLARDQIRSFVDMETFQSRALGNDSESYLFIGRSSKSVGNNAVISRMTADKWPWISAQDSKSLVWLCCAPTRNPLQTIFSDIVRVEVVIVVIKNCHARIHEGAFVCGIAKQQKRVNMRMISSCIWRRKVKK